MNKLKFYKIGFYFMLLATFILSMSLYNANNISKDTSDKTALDNLENTETIAEIKSDKADSETTIEPIIIYMTKKNDKVTVYVDGEKATYPDLLDILNIPLKEKGKDAEVHTVFTEDVMIDDVYNMFGVVSKVGFENIRYFIEYNDYSMVEVNLYDRIKPPKIIIDSKQ